MGIKHSIIQDRTGKVLQLHTDMDGKVEGEKRTVAIRQEVLPKKGPKVIKKTRKRK